MEIELKNITKVIRKNKVLDNVSYTFKGGCVYGLNGKNGCGKTMLMRCIAGLIYPTKGEVLINGKILGKDMSFPHSIGLLIENPAFLGRYTGFDNLYMLSQIKGKPSDEKIRDILEQVGLDPNDKRKYHKYSLGMRQRLGIAAAIMDSPDIIILDEPINAIDGDGVVLIRKLIRNYIDNERIIIIACHDIREMEMLADIIINMADGRIVEV